MNRIKTFSGKVFDYDNPTPDSICIEDIAHALSNVTRFAGHTKVHYSVAQHSIIVSGFAMAPLPELQAKYCLLGLLHDASEAYLGDVPTPWKKMLQFDYYRQMELKTMNAIFQALEVDANFEDLPPEIHKADKEAFYMEEAYLMNHINSEDNPYTFDTVRKFAVVPPNVAEKLFLEIYEEAKAELAPRIILASR